MEKISKRELPRNNKDVSVLRCIVKAINNKKYVDYIMLNIDRKLFETYLKALEKSNVIMMIDEKEGYHITNFIIANLDLADNYFKSGIYYFLEKRVLPFIPLIPKN